MRLHDRPTHRICGLHAILGLGALLLSSCLSGPAPTDHYYRIQVVPPAPGTNRALPGTLDVDRLRVEAIAQGRRMLYRDGSRPGEVVQYNYHHWADPPNVMIQSLLVDYLRSAGVAERVVTPGVHVDSDYRLTGRLVHFEQILGSGDPRVLVEVEIAIVRKRGDEVLLLETYREEREASGRSVNDAVTAYGAALEAIFGRLAADIPSA